MNDLKPNHNFSFALKKLKEFVSTDIATERDRAGVIQAFEFTFEQFWKAAQRIATQEGLEVKSPKQALGRALELGLIEVSDEEDWLMMLKDRNSTSHMYKSELAEKVCCRITGRYIALFEAANNAMNSSQA